MSTGVENPGQGGRDETMAGVKKADPGQREGNGEKIKQWSG